MLQNQYQSRNQDERLKEDLKWKERKQNLKKKKKMRLSLFCIVLFFMT